MHPASTDTPSRFPDEVELTKLAAELESCLGPLAEYCDHQEAAPMLSEADRQHLYQLTEFISAVGRYDQAAERLLAAYRHALEHAERPTQPVPTLEQALLAQMSPADLLAYREKDPVYRLGYARGYRKAEQQYERLTSLYAQYAIIVPPASYTPSPLIATVQRVLATRLMTGQRLPLPVRKSLFFNTPSDTTPPVTHGPK
ncbi:hypothetical protein FNT36_18420 [Hymenobacter setariae]|uniref:Uncharacterized protein n=1 Tax=Hymenobacter setariae TaxID=2594794 RepID=A0A558BSX8_9BACT|nr:hypothetical protein [Hymenobacter setariae]TVT39617.1 hypothetical protein FNT36_18420 [Hymenobacter setariae]